MINNSFVYNRFYCLNDLFVFLRSTFQFPRSMSAGEFSSTKRDSLASIPSALEFRQFKSTNKNIGNEFLGLCLPRDLSLLFQVSEKK